MKYIMSYKRSVSAVGALEEERIDRNKNSAKSMVDHRANVEDIVNVVKHIRNVDPEVREYQR